MKKTAKNKNPSVFTLLAQGRFAELEKILINNPQLREILIHSEAFRGTAFFKRRLRFYRQFAKKCGMAEFSPEVKNQIRDEFAKEHCLKRTLQRVMDSYDIATFTTEISRIRFNQMLKKRRKRARGLFA